MLSSISSNAHKMRCVAGVACAILLSFTIIIGAVATPAQATELADAQKQLRETSEKVEDALDDYNAAQDDIAVFDAEINALQAQIDEIEAELEEPREQLALIAKWQYTTGNEGFLEMLFDEDLTLEDFFVQAGQLEKITEEKAAAIAEISAGEEEIERARDEQVAKKMEAQARADEAKAIADAASADADALEEKIASLREEQREYLLGKGYSGGGPAYDIPEEGDVIDYALSRVGCPYVWGGSGDSSFDCSGLVMWAYKQAKGISLPHNSESMYSAAKEVVPLSQAQPGDVLYRSGHVGICTKAGAKEYVHAPTSGAYVRISDNVEWSGFTCALRF